MSLLDGKLLKRMWVTETPSGSGTSFTLSQTPLEPDALLVIVNGLIRSDWSLSGTTLTLGSALAAGQSIKVYYVQKTGGS